MTENLFLDWAIKLLEQIETSEEKKLWCRRYSVYSRSPGQETLSRDLHDFVDRTYQAGLVIQNYHEVIQKWGLEERNISIADPGWLETQPYLCVLACIAWHFRRDHFCEGSLISQSIAEGVLLRLFRRLKALCPTVAPPPLHCKNSVVTAVVLFRRCQESIGYLCLRECRSVSRNRSTALRRKSILRKSSRRNMRDVPTKVSCILEKRKESVACGRG